jgi:hypothetical protein
MPSIVLIAFLIAWSPSHANLGNVSGLMSPRPDSPRTQDLVRRIEGVLTGVDPETQTVKIETMSGVAMAFRYDKDTQVETDDQGAAGCFGPGGPRRVRVHFRVLDGQNTAVGIEVLRS